MRINVGVIVHAVSKIVLGNHMVKSIYGYENTAKTFIQGTIMKNVLDRHVLEEKKAIWKLTVDFEMPSDKTALGVNVNNLLVGGREILCTIKVSTGSMLCPPAPTMGAWAADAGTS